MTIRPFPKSLNFTISKENISSLYSECAFQPQYGESKSMRVLENIEKNQAAILTEIWDLIVPSLCLKKKNANSWSH